MEKMKTAAIISAGGRGLRLPGKVKKQFRELKGKPLLIRSMEPFINSESISDVIVALPADDIDYFTQIARNQFPATDRKMQFCAGGALRQDSVFNALKLCSPDTRLVIIHDGVRPFVCNNLLQELLEMTAEYGATIPGAPVKHTVKTIKDDIVDHTIRRDILLQVYTPQVFHYEILMKCYHRAMTEEYYSTDDAALLEHYGYSVRFINDSSFNLKVTDELDWFMAEQYLQYQENKKDFADANYA